jgi:hypothetical protein
MMHWRWLTAAEAIRANILRDNSSCTVPWRRLLPTCQPMLSEPTRIASHLDE